MLSLDHNAGFVLAAFGITWVVLGGYLMYLRSRLGGLRRRSPSTGLAASAGAPEPLAPPVAKPLTQPGR